MFMKDAMTRIEHTEPREHAAQVSRGIAAIEPLLESVYPKINQLLGTNTRLAIVRAKIAVVLETRTQVAMEAGSLVTLTQALEAIQTITGIDLVSVFFTGAES